MIPRSRRLPRKRIDLIFRKGKKTGNDCFTVRFIARPGTPINRYCVIVSSTVEPSAVRRNHLRRRIYEIIRLSGDAAPEGLDLIIMAKRPAAGMAFDRISSNILTLLRKLGR